MCAVKSPKIKTEEKAAPKPIIIRNPYLDGLDPTLKASREGRSALKIPRVASSALRIPVSAAVG